MGNGESGGETRHTPSTVDGQVVSYSAASPVSLWDDAHALMIANHKEVGCLEVAAFKPDLDRLAKMEQAGMTRGFVMHVDGRIAGYALFLVMTHWHYPGTKWALQDAMYVLPTNRGARAVEFMAYQDEFLIKDGADVIVRQVPTKVRADFSRTLTRFGYVPIETVFLRDVRSVVAKEKVGA